MRLAREVCEDHKAVDVTVYDMRGRSILADYYLFCSANSGPHIRAIVSQLDKAFKDAGAPARAIEGKPESNWVLLDLNDLLVHVLHPDARRFYSLESLTDGAPRLHGPAPQPPPKPRDPTEA